MKSVAPQIRSIERQLSARRITIRQLCQSAAIDESGWRRWRRGGVPKGSTWQRVVAAVAQLTGNTGSAAE